MGAILITRPQKETAKLAKSLRDMGRDVIECPLMKIELLKQDLSQAQDRSFIISSSNAIKSLDFNQIDKKSKIFLIGGKTSKLSKEMGFSNIKKVGESAQDIVKFFTENKEYKKNKFVYYCGEHLTLEVAEILTNVGYDISKIIGYRAHEAEVIPLLILSKISSGEISEILFFSNRTVEIFNKLTNGVDVSHIEALCISEKIRDNLSKRSWKNIAIFQKDAQWSGR